MDSEATMTLWEQRGLLAEPLRRGYERRWHRGAGARKYNHLRDAVRAMFEVDADGEGSPREAIFATLAVAHAVAENVGGHPNSALLRRCICAAVSHLGTDDGDARVGARRLRDLCAFWPPFLTLLLSPNTFFFISCTLAGGHIYRTR